MSDVQIIVDGKLLQMDDDTAIGISFQGFNFAEPGRIHLSYSNSFTVPLTSVNRAIFSFFDDMNTNSFSVNAGMYTSKEFRMYIDGAFIFSGNIYVDSYSEERMTLHIISGRDFFDTLKEVTLFDLTSICAGKINEEIDSLYPSGASFGNIVDYMASGDNSVWIPYAVGQLNRIYPYAKVDSDSDVVKCANKYDDTDNDDGRYRWDIDNESRMVTEFITDSDVVGDYKTGHLFVNLYDAINWTFSKYGYNVSFQQDVYDLIKTQYLRLVDLVLYQDLTNSMFSFRADDLYHYKIDDDKKAASAKIPFVELIKVIISEYCLVVDIDSDNNVVFRSFNSIKSIEPKTYESSAVLTRDVKIDGIPQVGWITYSGLGDSTTNTGGVRIVCRNTNVSAGGEDTSIFSINRFLPGYFEYKYTDSDDVQKSTYALNLSEAAINEKIVIVSNAGDKTPYRVLVDRIYKGNSAPTKYVNLKRAYLSTVSNNGYWDTFRQNCEYPEVITVECRIMDFELINFSGYNFARFSTIPGTWYIQSIDGYNPRTENSTVNVTAVRIR